MLFRSEIKSFCAAIERYKGTVCLLVPPIALLLARDPVIDQFDLSSLRLLISGAAPLGPELEKSLATRLKSGIAQVLSTTSSHLFRVLISDLLKSVRIVRDVPVVPLLSTQPAEIRKHRTSPPQPPSQAA